VTCPHIFCSDTGMLLQPVLVTVSE